MKTIHLGYEVGSGQAVEIPCRHLAITGQTQESGKTTTLEGLVARSGLRAVTFITKRGEGSFTKARRIAPYFREQADWQYVASILEASRGEKLKIERAWIIRASKGARTLADVQANVRAALPTAKGMSADMYLCLDAYLDVVVPQIASVKWAPQLLLEPGVNAMDLSGLAAEMQHLVIRSTITWVLEREENTVVVVPEAWKYIPQGRGTPVKLAAEAYIRQGAALRNYLWLDSQDLGGVEKSILRSVPVWLLGVQREANEIKRTLENIPASVGKPKAADIAQLRLGEFFACWHDRTVKVYVQPAWMSEEAARDRALGGTLKRAVDATIALRSRAQEDPAMCEKHQELERDLQATRRELSKVTKRADDAETALHAANNKAQAYIDQAAAAVDLGKAIARLLPAGADGDVVTVAVESREMEDALVAKVLSRIPMGGGGPVTVTPPEKLRKDFQQEEAARIVAAARQLGNLGKRVFKLLVGLEGQPLPQKQIAERLGRATGGGSWVALTSEVKALVELGFLEVDPKRGVRAAARAKIAADLATYQATEPEVEATYQAVLFELATEAAA